MRQQTQTNKTEWQEVELGEICEIKKGNSITKNTITNGDIPVIAGGQQPAYYHNTSNRVGETLTVSGSGAYAGFVAYFNIPIFASDCSTIQSKGKDMFMKYIYYLLKSNQNKIYKLQKGIAQPHVYPKDLAKIKIPLPFSNNKPDLKEQERIVKILEKAEKLKERGKNANDLLDEYLKSVFNEMFYNKGFEEVKLEVVGTLERGRSKHRPRNDPILLGGKYPLIQTGDIVNSGIYVTQYNQTYSEEGLAQSRLWKKGTLCITIAANIGETGILTFDACFPDSVVGVTPNNKLIISEYMHFLFLTYQKKLEESAPQSAQKNINLKILRNLKIPLPPLPLQQKFAEIVEQVEEMKENVKKTKSNSEELFSSLMSKAFRGEL